MIAARSQSQQDTALCRTSALRRTSIACSMAAVAAALSRTGLRIMKSWMMPLYRTFVVHARPGSARHGSVIALSDGNIGKFGTSGKGPAVIRMPRHSQRVRGHRNGTGDVSVDEQIEWFPVSQTRNVKQRQVVIWCRDGEVEI